MSANGKTARNMAEVFILSSPPVTYNYDGEWKDDKRWGKGIHKFCGMVIAMMVIGSTYGMKWGRERYNTCGADGRSCYVVGQWKVRRQDVR